MPKNMPDIKTRGFSIANMKDDYENASEQLFEAIQSQNPDVNYDRFDMELRALVMRFGGDKTSAAPNPGQYNGYRDFAAFASLIDTNNHEAVECIYNEAADIIVLAHETFNRGNRREARQLIETAFKNDDMTALIDALNINNKNSKIGLQAEESQENDEDWTDEDTNAPPTAALNDDDDDSSDNLDNSTDDEEEELTPSAKSDEDDEENEDSPKKVESSVKSPKIVFNKDNLLSIAAANKISISGKEEDRIKARRVAAA